MPMIPVADDVELFYTEEGDGPPVLLLHGWTCDGSDWSWLAADLAADHRVIVVDHRGHGRSSGSAGPFGAQVMSHDAAAVLRHLAVERAVVVGHSMGTIVASALAVEHPDLVSALVLVDPVYGQDDEALAPVIAGIRAYPVPVAQQIFASFYVEKTPDWLRRWHDRRLQGNPAELVTEAFCALYDGPAALGRAAVGQGYLAGRRCPVLAVYGRTGTAVAEWDRGLPHGPHDEIVVWDDGGHFLHQEQPERFAAEVRRWLSTVAAERTAGGLRRDGQVRGAAEPGS